MEEEIEEEVDKVLTTIAGETAAQLPEAVRKEKMKQPAQAAPQEVRLAQILRNVPLANLFSIEPEEFNSFFFFFNFTGRSYSRRS